MSNTMKLGRPIEILLVEDNPSDALITQEALRKGKVSNTLHLVKDGVEAMAFLRRQGEYANVPRPDVILLDLNLPEMSGEEVLKQIRADESLSSLPVIILTTSADERDVLAAYGLKANCFITKPVAMSQFIATMQALDSFWLTWVTPPHAPAE